MVIWIDMSECIGRLLNTGPDFFMFFHRKKAKSFEQPSLLSVDRF